MVAVPAKEFELLKFGLTDVDLLLIVSVLLAEVGLADS